MGITISNKKYLGNGLIFVISAPRSGSTLLQRMLASHSKIFTHPEPHILTPLAFQGIYYKIEKASFNHRVAAQALNEYIEDLPNGEEDYLDACREYCRVLYTRMLTKSGKIYFVDKTPNYADTILPFLVKLLPEAKYIILTRHPLAILSSDANTFYNGDYNLAHYSRDILRDFIPPIAKLLRSENLPIFHVRYEEIVSHSETTTKNILTFLGLEYEANCINFGEQKHITKTYGDPKINRHKKPVTSSLNSWVEDMTKNPDVVSLCRNLINDIPENDLETFGYPKKSIWNKYVSAKKKHTFPLKQKLDNMKWSSIWLLKRVSKTKLIKYILLRLSHLIDILLR